MTQCDENVCQLGEEVDPVGAIDHGGNRHEGDGAQLRAKQADPGSPPGNATPREEELVGASFPPREKNPHADEDQQVPRQRDVVQRPQTGPCRSLDLGPEQTPQTLARRRQNQTTAPPGRAGAHLAADVIRHGSQGAPGVRVRVVGQDGIGIMRASRTNTCDCPRATPGPEGAARACGRSATALPTPPCPEAVGLFPAKQKRTRCPARRRRPASEEGPGQGSSCLHGEPRRLLRGRGPKRSGVRAGDVERVAKHSAAQVRSSPGRGGSLCAGAGRSVIGA